MEPDATPLAESPDAGATAASPEPTTRVNPLRPFSLSRAMGYGGSEERGAALNGDAPVAPAEEGAGSDGKSGDASPLSPSDAPTAEPSAPTPEQPKPSQQPKTPGSRRSQEAEANAARIAELEAERVRIQAERETAVEQARQDERERITREQQDERERQQREAASRTSQADVDRFDAACRMIDNDPRLYEQVPGTDQTLYQWREAYKERLQLFPDVDRHYQQVSQQTVERERAQLAVDRLAYEQNVWYGPDGIVSQLQQAEALPNVKHEDLAKDAPTPLTTWPAVAAYYHDAGATWKAAELQPKLDEANETIERQAAEIKDLRLVGPRGLGSSRAPVHGGRSASSENGTPSTFDPNRSARENLRAAIAAGSGGS